MNIIAHVTGNVNIFAGGVDAKTSAIMAEEAEKWMEHKQAASFMAKKMEKAKLYARAVRMRECAELVSYTVCRDCGRKHVTHANLCRDRMCPLCSWRLSMRRYTQMVQIVDGLRKRYPESSWQMCTLTVANCRPQELTDTVNEMMRAWNYIASRDKTKERIIGWARSLEITYDKKTGTIHPHMHMLLLWQEGWEPTTYLVDMWLKTVRRYATKSAQDAHKLVSKAEYYELASVDTIPSIYDKPEQDKLETLREAVLETYKYAIKGSDLAEMPLGIFKAVDTCLHGRRLVAFGGVVKLFAKELAINMDDAESETSDANELEKCISCGSTKVIQIVGSWTGDGYLWRRTL